MVTSTSDKKAFSLNSTQLYLSHDTLLRKIQQYHDDTALPPKPISALFL